MSSPLGNALHMIADQELDFSESQIAAIAADRENAVHQCRKAIKRIRALVRMGRAVPGVHPRPIDRWLRDAARTLAPIRDASEISNTLRRVLIQHPWLKLLEGVEHTTASALEVEVSTHETLASLEKARSGLTQYFAENDAWTFANVVTGIESTYMRAAEHMDQFSRKNRDAIAHSWRKDVQRLGNQLATIKGLCPGFLPASVNTLAALADLLGEHNDLSVLRARIAARRSSLPKDTRLALNDVSKAQQRLLRRQALTIGGEFFAQSPEAFRDSLLGECIDSVA